MRDRGSARGRQARLAVFCCWLLIGGCVSGPVPTVSPTPTGAAAATPSAGLTTATAPETPDDATGCGRDSIEAVRAALAAVQGYRYSAAGFVHEEVYPVDPLASPSTRQVSVAFEGAYQAPDGSLLRYVGQAPEGEPLETRSIGRDLWVSTDDGWQHLPDAIEPTSANAIALLVDDFGGTWKPSGRPEPAGEGCLLVAREPTPGTKGSRELALRVDPLTSLPTILRAEVRGAVDRNGNPQDSLLEYLFIPDAGVAILPPESASPPS